MWRSCACVCEGKAFDPTLPSTPAAALDALAARVARLHQGHRDPEAFYEQRSEIAGELRRLARALDYTK